MNQLANSGMLPTTAQPLIIALDDPFDHTKREHEWVDVGTTVAENLERYDLTSQPTLVMHNARPLLEREWQNTRMEKGDVLTLVREPGLDPVSWAIIITAIVVAIASLYMILTLDLPEPGNREDSPNYSVSYRGNRTRPGKSLPCIFGTYRTFCDLSGQFKDYRKREQVLYQLFDITLGEVDTDAITASDIQYENTPLDAFEDYEYEIIPPGQPSSLFPTAVHVSTEVSGIELVDHTEWSPFYITNPVGTSISKIAIDITAPNGSYRVDDKGRYKRRYIHYEIEWQEVGKPETVRSRSTSMGYSKIPIAHTKWLSVATPGRYEVRVRRVSPNQTKTNISDDLSWTGLRAYEPDVITTETTRMAIRVRASRALGNASLSRMSVLVKRKLPTYSGGSWSAPVQTNLAAWAFAEAVRAEYGGNLDDKFLDIPMMEQLAATGIEFNGIYDSKQSLWDCLNEVARVFNGRAIQKPGGVYSIARDLPDQVPVALYTMRNIVADSFGVQHVLPVDEKVNFTRVTYQDKDQGYRETTVDCVPNGIVADQPYTVKLRGVTDSLTAYSIGIRMANESLHRRKRISFETGNEGFICNFMDSIRVAHYQLGLEQTLASVSGEVKSNAGNVLTVFEDLTELVGQGNLRTYLMDTDGSPWGPVSCTVPDDTTIDLGANTPPAGILVYSDKHAGPKFAVGASDDFLIDAKVTKVVQAGEHRVRIECVEDSPQVYGEPGDPGGEPLEPPEDLTPRVSNLTAVYYGSDDALNLRLTWEGVNSDYYIVETSEDAGATYVEVDSTTSTESQFEIDLVSPLHVRVFGISLFPGPPAYLILDPINRDVSYPPIYDLQPLYPFTGATVGVQWQALPVGRNARIKFIFAGIVVKQVDVGPETYFAECHVDEVKQVLSYTYLGEVFAGPGARTVTVRMYGLTNIDGTGFVEDTEYAELIMTNDPMTELLSVNPRVSGNQLDVSFEWPERADIPTVFVHLSQTSGFTPGAADLIFVGDSNSISIPDVLAFPQTYYLRMAGCDSWGPDSIIYHDEIEVRTTSPLYDYFVDGVLQIPHGGTASTTATGSGETVLATSPVLAGNPQAPTPSPGDSDTSIATTAFVTNAITTALEGVDLSDLEARVSTLEGYFTGGVLDVVHGGTGVTAATGSGTRVVLQTSPDLWGSPTSTTPPANDSTARIATTAYVQGELQDMDVGDLELRVSTLEGYFTGGVLDVLHGGTGVTAATGSGSKFVLQSSPDLWGVPTAQTASPGTSTAQIATTAFVQTALGGVDLSALEARVSTLEGYFSGGVLKVLNGGTGVSDSTGTGTRFVLQSSPDLWGVPTAPTATEGTNTAQIATTAFVQTAVSNVDLSGLESRVSTLEGYFSGGVLAVIHGGTGVTSATGTGSKFLLQTSPDIWGVPTAPTATEGTNTAQIATTEFVQTAVSNVDLSGLESRVNTLEGYFSGGVLAVIHGGTGVTSATGTGSKFVLQSSPDLWGVPTATTAAPGTDTGQIATTAFVQAAVQGVDLSDLENRVNTLEGYFSGGVLAVANGGTGVTAATGSGSKFLLQTSPDIWGNPTTTTQALSDSSQRIATTAFVQGLVSQSANDYPVYVTQETKTITTTWSDMGTRIFITPSSVSSLFRVSATFHYYPDVNTWHRFEMFCANGNQSTKKFAMSRGWDGGYFALEGQTKTYYFGTDGTLNPHEFYVQAALDGGSHSATVTFEVQEVLYVVP